MILTGQSNWQWKRPPDEDGGIRMIQVLLGHKRLETTALYTQVATEVLREVDSPLESLRPPA